MSFYVYQYSDPETLAPFYIGKGSGNRFLGHVKGDSSSKRVQDKIKNIRKRGLEPKIEIVEAELTEEESYLLEENLIAKYGRKGIDDNGILMNICSGREPPQVKSKPLIEFYYSLVEDCLISKEVLIREIDTFLFFCKDRRKYHSLLKTSIGKSLILFTKHFPEKFTIPQRIYHLNHGDEIPVCEYCSGPVRFKQINKNEYRYGRFCSSTCRNKSDWGREISSSTIHNEETKKHLSKIVREQYRTGKKVSIFSVKNPMKTESGKLKWRESRRAAK